jgi:hypothetical protein
MLDFISRITMLLSALITLASFAATAASPPLASFKPSPVALPIIPTYSVDVTAFGAIANDAKDDSKAIQRALDAVNAKGGGTLVFPKGQYDLSINPLLRRALTIYPRMRWRGVAGATIRLSDAQPIYESILAPASYPTRLDDIEFIGLTFDANGLANPVRNSQETNGDAPGQTENPTMRYAIRSFVGARARILNCTFANSDNGNTLSFNGNDISDVTIENSQFLNVGGARIDHDHSSVYLYGERMRLVNNEFRSRKGAGTLGARTAFETHGDDVEASGNLVDGFVQGANIVGRMSNPSRQLIAHNQFLNVAVGLNIWPLADGFVGPAFTTLMIQNNTVMIDADAWWRSPAMVVNHTGGVHFESDVARAPIARLEVSDNQITFMSFASKRAEADRFSAGIDVRGVENLLRVANLVILRNTIRNAPGPCIIGAAIVGSAQPSQIARNTLIDCGRSGYLVGEADALRTGILIAGKTVHLSVTDNKIIATGAEPVTLTGVVIASSCEAPFDVEVAPTEKSCEVENNSVRGLESSVRNVGTGW